MKKEIYFALFSVFLQIFFVQKINAQNNHFYLSVSNNGQISEEINSFYFSNIYSDNARKFNKTQFQLSINYERIFRKYYIIGFKAGYQSLSNHLGLQPYMYSSANQKIFNFSISAQYVLKKENLRIATGLEMPYFHAKTGYFSYLDETITPSRLINYKTDGGYVIGINSITSFKYFLTKHIFCTLSLSFGYLNYNLGGQKETVIIRGSASESFISHSYYKNKYFSNPVISFGFGLNL